MSYQHCTMHMNSFNSFKALANVETTLHNGNSMYYYAVVIEELLINQRKRHSKSSLLCTSGEQVLNHVG